MKKRLNVREQRFVESVLGGQTYTQAAIDAGYVGEHAGEAGYELAARPHVQAAIRERIREETAAEPKEVLGVLTAHLRGDIADLADFFQADGCLDLKAAKRAGISRTVKKYKTRRAPIRNKQGEVVDYATITEIEMYCAQAAARSLADIMGIKQMPRANEHDEDLRREGREEALKLFAEYVTALGGDEAKARELFAIDAPTMSQYVN